MFYILLVLLILVINVNINSRPVVPLTVYLGGNSVDVFIVGLPSTANKSRGGVRY